MPDSAVPRSQYEREGVTRPMVDDDARRRVAREVDELVRRHGHAILEDSVHLRAVLRDLLPADSRAVDEFLASGADLPPAGGTSSVVDDGVSTVPQPGRKERPARVWAIAAATALALAVVVGGAVVAIALTGGAGSESAITCPDGSSASDVDECPSEGPTGSEPKKPRGDRRARAVECWDGARAESAVECTVPRGTAGLRWVFPGFDRRVDRCGQVPQTSPDGKLQAWFCPLGNKPLPRGSSGFKMEGLRYSEWDTARSARSHLVGDFGFEPRRIRQRGDTVAYLWVRSYPNEHGIYRLAIAYPDWPYTLAIGTFADRTRQAVCERERFRSSVDLTMVGCSE